MHSTQKPINVCDASSRFYYCLQPAKGQILSRCGGNGCLYDLPDKTIFALYADEPICQNDDATTSWRVQRNTVIQITVNFKVSQPLSALDIDVTKYDRVPDKELHGLVYLSDYIEGVRLETSGETVRAITYYPAARDDNLRCPRKPRG